MKSPKPNQTLCQVFMEEQNKYTPKKYAHSMTTRSHTGISRRISSNLICYKNKSANAPFAWIIRLHNGEWSMGMNKRCVRSILQTA